MSILSSIRNFLFPPKSVCAVCLRVFNDRSLELIDSLALCRKDYSLFKSGNHQLFKTAICSEDSPEAGVKLFSLHKELLQEGKKPYIRSEYETHDDKIITKLSLYLINY